MKIDPSLLYKDELTNVYNRRYLRDRIPQIFKEAKHRGKKFAVLFLDIDKFKEINDTWGHSAGDEALIEFSSIVKKSIRKKDILIRYGGDEFVVILPNTTLRKATEVAKRIIRNLNNPENWVKTNFMRKTSIGIAIYPNDSEHLETLIEIADTRMYCAKKAGTGFLCYTDSLPGTILHDIEVNLVGREKIFRELVSLLDEAKSGKFVNVLLEGPTGTGKREILEALAEKAGSEGFAVINIPTRFSERFEPHFVIRELVFRISRLEPELFEEVLLLGGVNERSNVERLLALSESLDDSLLEKFLTRLIDSMSGLHPLFLGISNIENIHPRALKILSSLQLSPVNHPVYILQTFDEANITFKVATRDYVKSIKSLPNTRMFKIEPFDKGDTERLISLLLGGPVPEPVSRKIYRVSRGYPMRIKLILDHLHRMGYLRHEDGRWYFEKGFEKGIENWLREYVKETFNVLTSKSLKILKVLALLGKVKVDHLYDIVDGDELSFYESLSDLSFYGLIKEDEGVISFRQDEIKDVVRKELLRKDDQFQRFVAEKIIEIFGVNGAQSDNLLTAARIFLDIGDTNHSASIIDTIIDKKDLTSSVNIKKLTSLLTNFPDSSRSIEWANKLLFHFSFKGQYKVAEELLRTWRKHLTLPGILWINFLLKEVQCLLKAGKFSEVLSRIEENYWFVKRNGDAEIFLKILYLKGKALEFSGEYKKAKFLYSRIVGLARKHNKDALELLGLLAFINLNFETNPVFKVNLIFKKYLLPLFREHLETESKFDWFIYELSRVYANMDYIDEFFKLVEDYEERDEPDYFTLAHIYYMKSEVYLRLGKFEESLNMVRSSRNMLEKFMSPEILMKHYVIEAVNLFLLGRNEELKKLNMKVEKMPISRSFMELIKVLYLLKSGLGEKAYRLLRRHTEIDSRIGFYYRILNLLTFFMIKYGVRNISYDEFVKLERESNAFTPIERTLLYFNGFAIGIFSGNTEKSSDYLNKSVLWAKKALSQASDKKTRASILSSSPFIKPIFQGMG